MQLTSLKHEFLEENYIIPLDGFAPAYQVLYFATIEWVAEITDWNKYENHLREMMGYDNKMMRSFTDMAKA